MYNYNIIKQRGNGLYNYRIVDPESIPPPQKKKKRFNFFYCFYNTIDLVYYIINIHLINMCRFCLSPKKKKKSPKSGFRSTLANLS